MLRPVLLPLPRRAVWKQTPGARSRLCGGQAHGTYSGKKAANCNVCIGAIAGRLGPLPRHVGRGTRIRPPPTPWYVRRPSTGSRPRTRQRFLLVHMATARPLFELPNHRGTQAARPRQTHGHSQSPSHVRRPRTSTGVTWNRFGIRPWKKGRRTRSRSYTIQS